MTRPDTMRAVTATDGAVTMGSRPVPQPGRDEILIRVVAAGINRADLAQRQGRHAPPPGASDVLGLEVSGIVEAVGPEDPLDIGPASRIPAPQPGDRVCALLAGGGYADYVIASRQCVLPVPGDLDMVEAAALPEAAFTVWDNMVTRGELDIPKAVLVHAGASGVGTLALQLARTLDCRIFATAGTEAKRAACVSLGAERAFDYRTEDWAAEINAQCGGADIVLDLVGASHLAKNLEVMAPEGRLITIGFVGGATADLDMRAVARKRLTLTGSLLRGRNAVQKSAIAEAVYAGLWPKIARREIEPIIHTTFALEDVDQAHTLLAGDSVIGKLVLEVDRALCTADV
ncbi:NADPH/quinone reductase and related Zn-dependent oxidoreductase [alpha proteobacterium BAL199]|jgi:NADPH:quinone reductase|nr:NADPH/quinone reductase and related Zn-dependent oxidoreductase [alpha proteobacterium BAL199]